MMDDIDRECCSQIFTYLKNSIEDGTRWHIASFKVNDPGITVVLEHKQTGANGYPCVTVDINYGRRKND